MRKKIIIWGTGNWSNKLLAALNADCEIVAFVETKPEKDEFQGIKVIDAKGGSDLYKMAARK